MIGQAEEARLELWGTVVGMPRYHLKVTGSNLGAVKEEVRIAVTDQGSGLKVVLHAKDAAAAKALVEARLPKGGDAQVGDADPDPGP